VFHCPPMSFRGAFLCVILAQKRKMAKNIIAISGAIERYGYSANYLKYMLSGCTEGHVTLVVNSPGGDVNEAIVMGNLIAEHGDVTVEYVGYNASAATLLGLYAKESTINSDCLHMAHKTMVWVDAWGQMNEDQIEAAITELTARKETASVSTLQLAKIYSEHTGKPVNEMLQMMKEAKWLSPEDAVSIGLVGKVIPSKAKKKKVENSVAAMYASNGIPLPSDLVDPETEPTEPSENGIFNTIENIVTDIKNFLIPNNSNTNPVVTMNKDFTIINQLLKVEGFEVKDGVVSLTVEQLTALHTAMQSQKTDATALETARTAESTATNNLNSVITALDALDDTVKNAADAAAKTAAVKNLLDKRPSVIPPVAVGSDIQPAQAIELDPVNNFFNS